MQPAMIPIAFLEERRRQGQDRHDEVWEGVYHLVPSPTPTHQRVARDLLRVFMQIAARRGLHVFYDLDVHDRRAVARTDYRQLDLSVVEERIISKRGIEGNSHLAVEVISPDDESRDKLPFYAKVGVLEVWLLDPRKLTIEVFAGLDPVAPVGVIHAKSLGLELRVDGHLLRIQDGADMYEVDIRDSI